MEADPCILPNVANVTEPGGSLASSQRESLFQSLESAGVVFARLKIILVIKLIQLKSFLLKSEKPLLSNNPRQGL